jgi:hypothetical protein
VLSQRGRPLLPRRNHYAQRNATLPPDLTLCFFKGSCAIAGGATDFKGSCAAVTSINSWVDKVYKMVEVEDEAEDGTITTRMVPSDEIESETPKWTLHIAPRKWRIFVQIDVDIAGKEIEVTRVSPGTLVGDNMMGHMKVELGLAVGKHPGKLRSRATTATAFRTLPRTAS